MTEAGKTIEELQHHRALVLKRMRFNEKQLAHHRTKVLYHQTWLHRREDELAEVDKQLDSLLDAKLSTVDSIQRESGEWSDEGSEDN